MEGTQEVDKVAEEAEEEEVPEEIEEQKGSEEEVIETGTNKPLVPILTLNTEQKSNITEAFNLLDLDGSGLIDADYFKIVIKALGYEVTSEEMKMMLESVGETTSGKLSVDDFTTLIKRKIAEKDSEFDILKSFLHFDINDNDYLTLENMKTVVELLEEDLNDEEILEMFEEADEDSDGCISRSEFIKMINRCVTLVTP